MHPSCILDNLGYPAKLVFDKEGGSTIIDRVGGTPYISIDDYDGNELASIDGYNESGEPLTAEYEWLKVELNGSNIKTTALPNNSGKKRKLYLNMMVLDLRATVSIIQR